ncbi:FkbM family methyltransferase [Flavobacterium maritimum]|uniref:FkbM family methyltransferase n=1 Tax=Flavobacterium maritimum TaxID=3149042 RepID=UPI0032B45A1B
MKKKLRQKVTKFLGYIGITPYIYYAYKFNDPFLVKKKLFRNKPIVIFDVGAHDGRSITLYKKHFTASTIFSFEPTPKTYLQLEKTAKKYSNSFVFNIALTSFIGQTEFYLNNSSLTNSLLKSSDVENALSKVIETKEKIIVNTNTIDQFCIENKIERINILKIDVQGADLNVLIGATNMLKEQKIDLIFVEVEFIEMYENQPLFHDVSLFLRSLNYDLFSFYNMSIDKMGQIIYGDAIFLPKFNKM